MKFTKIPFAFDSIMKYYYSDVDDIFVLFHNIVFCICTVCHFFFLFSVIIWLAYSFGDSIDVNSCKISSIYHFILNSWRQVKRVKKCWIKWHIICILSYSCCFFLFLLSIDRESCFLFLFQKLTIPIWCFSLFI